MKDEGKVTQRIVKYFALRQNVKLLAVSTATQ